MQTIAFACTFALKPNDFLMHRRGVRNVFLFYPGLHGAILLRLVTPMAVSYR